MGICGMTSRMISIAHRNWLICRHLSKFWVLFLKFESRIEESFSYGFVDF